MTGPVRHREGRIRDAQEAVIESTWAAVSAALAIHFPEAESGDVPWALTFRIDRLLREMVEQWVDDNAPEGEPGEGTR